MAQFVMAIICKRDVKCYEIQGKWQTSFYNYAVATININNDGGD